MRRRGFCGSCATVSRKDGVPSGKIGRDLRGKSERSSASGSVSGGSMKPAFSSTSRRRFLGTTLGASLAPFILPSGLRAQNSPNGKLAVAIIGTGKQAGGLTGKFLRHPAGVVVAGCDVGTNRGEAAKKRVEDHYGKNQNAAWKGCTAHNDFREVLGRKDIDAVVIATPDHWHAIISVAA